MMMIKEFKEFAMKGNMLDMAVGIVLGAGFSAVVNSLVNDILMPPIGLMLGGADFSELFLTLKTGAPAGPYASLALAKEAGAVTLNYGIFINALVNFLIVAFALFIVVRMMNRMRGEEPEEEEKE
jgi:large conductance mechanosensitive channel